MRGMGEENLALEAWNRDYSKITNKRTWDSARSRNIWIPWFEQKKPCRHLGQDSFDDALVEETAVGEGMVFFFTGVITCLTVVCFPVLHLDHREKLWSANAGNIKIKWKKIDKCN